MKDGQDVGIDLTGGYYDAGSTCFLRTIGIITHRQPDYLKATFPLVRFSFLY